MVVPGYESTETLSILISLLLVFVTYSQFRIQSQEFRPDLSVQKVAHYDTVCADRETIIDKSEIATDEILFEITNLGSGTAMEVCVESELWVIDTGEDVADDDTKIASTKSNLTDFQIPRTLELDIAREDVYHSDWTETMEATVPGDQTETGYLARLHVRGSDKSVSFDELLTREFPEKAAFRLRLRLVYTGLIEFRDHFSVIIDSVVFPGVCDDLGEAMAAQIPFSRYDRKSHNDAVLDARANVEQYRQRNVSDDTNPHVP